MWSRGLAQNRPVTSPDLTADDWSGAAGAAADGWIEIHGLERGTVRVVQANRGTRCDVDT